MSARFTNLKDVIDGPREYFLPKNLDQWLNDVDRAYVPPDYYEVCKQVIQSLGGIVTSDKRVREVN